MKTLIIVLVYLSQPASAWHNPERIEYEMPSMAACQEAVKSAKISSAQKGSVSIFCAYKEKP